MPLDRQGLSASLFSREPLASAAALARGSRLNGWWLRPNNWPILFAAPRVTSSRTIVFPPRRPNRAAIVEPTVCHIDDFGPLPVVRPQAIAEVGDLVRRAAQEGQALYPLGGRTMLGLGMPPSRLGIGVDLRALTTVIDYPARDMTITVQAGITIAELQRLLATEKQRLPVDVPLAAQATLGGTLATNTSGPRRLAFGTLRDYVIGITTINDEGQETKAGGRVVKNVAGYDLCKLHIGALGTLGIISQVTLKLRPLPETRALLTVGCATEGLEALLDQLHRSRTHPVCVEVLNQAAARSVALASGGALPELGGSPWVVLVGYEDSDKNVVWQMKQLIAEMSPAGGQGLEARAGSASDSLWQALVEFTAYPPATISFKANLLPSAVAGFCKVAAAFPEGVLLQAHAGSGIVRCHIAGDLTLERAQAMLKELHTAAEAAQGNVVLPRCPPAWKKTLPVWGRQRGDAELMRQVIGQLDPRRLFNPGRFLQGI
jgi:glycolate oxidase FAD binding subunit